MDRPPNLRADKSEKPHDLQASLDKLRIDDKTNSNHHVDVAPFEDEHGEVSPDEWEGANDDDEDDDVDDDEYEEEDDEEEDDEDGTQSMSSTRSEPFVTGIMENGRRYCNDTYLMPNDEHEQTRLSVYHQVMLMILDGKLTKAPIPPKISRVLDVGTGPGDWAVEMGQMYPKAEVIATDISVFDAGPAVLGLPNVHFQLDDAEEEWTYREPFDLIHMRGLSAAIRNWRHVYQQAFKHLKAGGYIEVVDNDMTANIVQFRDRKVQGNSYYQILVEAMSSATKEKGYPPPQEHLKPSMLLEAGFVDVRVFEIAVPVGTWPQEPRQRTLGKLTLVVLLEGLEAKCLRLLTSTGKWTADEVRDLIEKAKQEIVSAEGITLAVKFLTGRKPMAYAPHRIRHRHKIDQIMRQIELDEEESNREQNQKQNEVL